VEWRVVKSVPGAVVLSRGNSIASFSSASIRPSLTGDGLSWCTEKDRERDGYRLTLLTPQHAPGMRTWTIAHGTDALDQQLEQAAHADATITDREEYVGVAVDPDYEWLDRPTLACSRCNGTGVQTTQLARIQCRQCGGSGRVGHDCDGPRTEPVTPPVTAPQARIDNDCDDTPIPEPGGWVLGDRLWPRGASAAHVCADCHGWEVYDTHHSVIAAGIETGDAGKLAADRAIDEYRAGLAGLDFSHDGWHDLAWLAGAPDSWTSVDAERKLTPVQVEHPTSRMLIRLGWVDAEGRVTDKGRDAWKRRGGGA
jgi:hypothetical protein